MRVLDSKNFGWMMKGGGRWLPLKNNLKVRVNNPSPFDSPRIINAHNNVSKYEVIVARY